MTFEVIENGQAVDIDKRYERFGAGTSGTAILKGDGAGGFASAVAGTDYAPATSGSSILKGNGSGGFSTATAGTDYVAPGGALGTPSSGTATHLTGLPVAGISATGTASSTTFLRGDGTWQVPSGTGSGDCSTNTTTSVDSTVALFSGTAGKTIKLATGSGIASLSSGVLSTVAAPTGTIVGTSDTQTLANKTISGSSNTLSNIALSSLSSNVSLSGTYASLPTSGFQAGRIYYCTDIDRTYRDTGSGWVLVDDSGGPIIGDPTALSWTQQNVGTATMGNDRGCRLITAPSTGGTAENCRFEYVSGFGSGKTVTAKIDWNIEPNVNVAGFVCVSDGTKIIGWGVQNGNLIVMKLTNANTYIGAYSSSSAYTAPYYTAQWWRIRDDGTNLNYEVSVNGIDWFAPFPATARTNFLTPIYAGWCLDMNSSTKTSTGRLRQFSVA